MPKFLLLLLMFSVLYSCIETDATYHSSGQGLTTDASGRQYNLDPSKEYCGPGWGRKFCRFLRKYDETIWADTPNYYSDYPDIRFSNFARNGYFVSFFHLDSVRSRCEGWKLGESTHDGVTRKITIKKDEEDALWLGHAYQGANGVVERTVTYKYEVIEGSLHFSSTEGQTFVFSPSERNYSKDSIDTGEIVISEGCIF